MISPKNFLDPPLVIYKLIMVIFFLVFTYFKKINILCTWKLKLKMSQIIENSVILNNTITSHLKLHLKSVYYSNIVQYTDIRYSNKFDAAFFFFYEIKYYNVSSCKNDYNK